MYKHTIGFIHSYVQLDCVSNNLILYPVGCLHSCVLPDRVIATIWYCIQQVACTAVYSYTLWYKLVDIVSNWFPTQLVVLHVSSATYAVNKKEKLRKTKHWWICCTTSEAAAAAAAALLSTSRWSSLSLQRRVSSFQMSPFDVVSVLWIPECGS